MIGLNQFDILTEYASKIKLVELQNLRKTAEITLKRPHWNELLGLFEEFPDLSIIEDKLECDLTGDVIQVGSAQASETFKKDVVSSAVKALIPWRKGPFEIFGEYIDAEWQSNLKWDRIAPYLGDLGGKRVADVGCNNGYYMFRLSQLNPELVVGMDPSERCYYQFQLFQHFLRDRRLIFEYLGIEHLSCFPEFFDLVLCLGIIYHRRSPLDALRLVKDSLKPGGTAVIENLVIPGDEPTALCVADRYAKMHNIYFIPTISGLEAWIEKAGFVEIETFASSKVTLEEQRKTVYAPFQSLEDFLDPEDEEKTVEGYPAPIRACVRAKKKS